MLTLRYARTIVQSVSSPGGLAIALGALAALAAVSAASSARADGISVFGCVGSRYSISCVERWGSYSDPYVRLLHPQTEAEKTLAAQRDHKWQARCRPAVFQDRYGVPRYEYAAPGCEFGVTE